MATKTAKTLGIMTVEHKRWKEFVDRLSGPEGVNFQPDPKKGVVWKCQAGKATLPKATKILKAMGASAADIRESRDYFHQNGGYCDCEVLLNIAEAA